MTRAKHSLLLITAIVGLTVGWVANFALNSQYPSLIPSSNSRSQVAHALAWLLVALAAGLLAGYATTAGISRLVAQMGARAQEAAAAVQQVGAQPVPFVLGIVGGGVIGLVLGSRLFDAAAAIALAAILVHPDWGSVNTGAATVVRARQGMAGATLAFVVGAVVSVGSAQAASNATDIEVPADRPFVTTGVVLQPGDTLTIDAGGSVRFVSGDSNAIAGPDGSPASYWGCGETTYCGVLVGWIGGSGPFPVGKHFSHRIQTGGGELILGVNNTDFAGSSGSFNASIQVTRPAAGAQVITPVVPRLTPLPVAPPSPATGGVAAALACAVGGTTGVAVSRALALRSTSQAVVS